MWTPFLEQAGGIAPDLPGFGGTAKRGDLDYTIEGYADWLERFCDHVGLDRVRLVMHDWGVVGLAFAQRAPERVERIVAIDVVPFLPGYRWHPIARVWRVPLLGEAAMGMAVRPVVRRLLPPGRAEPVLAAFDPGTQRAILLLYRASPPEVLAQAGRGSARSADRRSSCTARATATSRRASPTDSPPRSATDGSSTLPAQAIGRGSSDPN